MNPSSPDAVRPLLEVRSSRCSSVIVHRVAPGSHEVFLEWQRGITTAAESFPGYQATEVYPPAADRPQEWVILIHFESAKRLQDWLDSPQRAEWTAKLPREIGEFRLKTLPSGFAAWFDDLAVDGVHLPHWKVFLMVLFGLYPTIMVLNLYLSPHTKRFGLAVAILIGNVVSCVFLEWLGSPLILFLFRPWLRAKGKEGRGRNLVGTLLIIGSLIAMAVLFHLLAA